MIPEYLYHALALSRQMTVVQFPLHSTTPAYIDPGTGSLIIQVAIGALVGGLVAARVFWQRIIGFFRGLVGGSSRSDKADK